MPEEKIKSENYTNFGGINLKASHYITSKNEFLKLENVDFRLVGSLSSFAGTTQFNTQGSSSQITGISDHYARNITLGFYAYTYTIIATNKDYLNNITGTTFSPLLSFIYYNNPAPFSFSKNAYLFGSNQYDFFTFTGATAWQYSLPAPCLPSPTGWITGYGTTGGITGTITLSWTYLRADGFLGPASSRSFDASGQSGFIFLMPTLITNIGFGSGISQGSFGISGVLVWLNAEQDSFGDLLLCTFTPFLPSLFTAAIIPLSVPTIAISYPASGGGGFGSSFGSVSLDWLVPSAFGIDTVKEDYFGTFLYGFNTANGASQVIPPGGSQVIVQAGTNPSTLETYSNQLFAGGFLLAPDEVWFSQIGNYEKHDFDAFFEVSANDGDIVSCIINYFTQLIIFKINSTHALTGQDSDNYQLSTVTREYGCLSSRSAVTWRQNLWFLDKAGICEFNGANTQIVSNKMQPYFDRMNVPFAQQQAIMLHVKERNEIWCAIPIDDAVYNNIIIVYDYLADAWTTRTTDQTTALSLITRGIDKEVVYTGNYSGSIFRYGNSLFQDNGQNFTSVIQTRFLSDLGHSVEKQWRRLFLDAKVPDGATYVFGVNFYADQGTSAVLQTTLTLSKFQDRFEFGIPSKDLSVELIYNGGSFLQLNGFTIEYRYQRAV